MDSAAFLAITLAVVGFLLFVAEVFIPSGGAISVVAVICLLIALFCGWSAWWEESPLVFWTYLVTLLVLTPLVMIGCFALWPHTPFGKRALLEAPTPEEVSGPTEHEEKLAQMVGKLGTTLTMLNPAGLVSIDGQRVHASSEGMIVETGRTVRIVEVRGNRLQVRLADGESVTAVEEAGADGARDEPLDFELPPS